MNRRSLLKLAAAAPFVHMTRKPTAQRILYIDLDDLSLYTITSPDAHAPNLVAFFKRSLYYANYWGGPLCSRDRAARITGLYAFRPNNLIGGVINPLNPYSLPVTGDLLPQRISCYKVHRGKWHLAQWTNLTHPGLAGYDAYSGPIANIGDYFDFEKDIDGTAQHTTTYATLDTATDVLIDITLGVPFIHASFNAIHQPFHEPPVELAPSFGPPWTYGKMALAALEAVDTCLGRIFLEADRRGYLTALLCDNGTDKLIGGGKGTLSQKGINVPLALRGPGIAPGTSQRLVCSQDIYPTLCALAGGTPADSDGVDFIYGPPRSYALLDAFPGAGAAPPPEDHDWAVRDARWKLIRPGSGKHELYNLLADPGEAVDLWTGSPTRQEQAVHDRLEAQIPT